MSSAAQAFFIKRGDTSPSIGYVLPSNIDLTGATARFSMRADGGEVKVSRALAVIVTATGTPTLRYDWQSADTDTKGKFDAEFEVTYSGGAIETFPNFGMIVVQVSEDVA